MMRFNSVKDIFNTVLILLFLTLISSSFIAMLISDKATWSDAEKRSLAVFPSLPTSLHQGTAFFAAVDDYLDDHFGFREFYIRRYQRELEKRFDITSTSSRVIKGLDGWYFLNKFNLLQDFLGLTPLKNEQLQAWRTRQEEKRLWLQQRGIRYLYMAIPNKQMVYQQFLMTHSLSRKGITRFEQLRTFFGNQLPEYMIDLHQVLRPEAYTKPLYYKYDSHWTQYGAYITFQEIMKKIAEWFPGHEFVTEFAFGPDVTGIGGNTGQGGDLAIMLMQQELTETYPKAERFKRCASHQHFPIPLSNTINGEGRDSFMRICKTRELRAVVFRDSFFVSLEPFLSENFHEIIYLWKEYDSQNLEEILAHFKPDIVIEAIVERHAFDALLNSENGR